MFFFFVISRTWPFDTSTYDSGQAELEVYPGAERKGERVCESDGMCLWVFLSLVREGMAAWADDGCPTVVGRTDVPFFVHILWRAVEQCVVLGV